MANGTSPRKSERTRQRILDAALALFSTRGFNATTMRDIAAHAGVSPGLTYRYFARKEDLAVALYETLSETLHARVCAMSGGTVAERFSDSMLATVTSLDAHREAFLALAARAFDPNDALGVLGDRTDPIREAARQSYTRLVREASDPPDDIEGLAGLLYTLHFVLVLIWTQDRDPARVATREAIALCTAALSTAQPLLDTPHGSMMLSQVLRIASMLRIARPTP